MLASEPATQSKASPTGREDDGNARLPQGQFFEFRAFNDGTTSFSFDPRHEQHPSTVKDIHAIQGAFTVTIWQLLWWVDAKLHALTMRSSMLTEMLEKCTTKGVH